jgi:hypothetical protein
MPQGYASYQNPAELILDLDASASFSKGDDSRVLFVTETGGRIVDRETGAPCTSDALEDAELVLVFQESE